MTDLFDVKYQDDIVPLTLDENVNNDELACGVALSPTYKVQRWSDESDGDATASSSSSTTAAAGDATTKGAVDETTETTETKAEGEAEASSPSSEPAASALLEIAAAGGGAGDETSTPTDVVTSGPTANVMDRTTDKVKILLIPNEKVPALAYCVMQLVGTPNVDVQADATITTDGVEGMTNGVVSMSGPGGDASGAASGAASGTASGDASGAAADVSGDGELSEEEAKLEKEEEKLEKDIVATASSNR